MFGGAATEPKFSDISVVVTMARKVSTDRRRRFNRDHDDDDGLSYFARRPQYNYGVNLFLLWWTFFFAVTQVMQPFAQGWTTSVTGESDFNVSAVEGKQTELPCDITPPIEDDKTHLVLWYKHESGNPIYTLDLREKKAMSTAQYPPEDIRSRVTFFVEANPPYLLIKNVRAEDQGMYRCRVDFKKSRTRNGLVNLNIVVPPNPPIILGEKGLEIGPTIGPYNEGSNLFLSCEVDGGRPPPIVTWWRDGVKLDDSFEVTSLGLVRNDLMVQSLSRGDYLAVYTCRASNNNITGSKETSITLDMNLKPLTINILEAPVSVSADKPVTVKCRSTGSRPTTKIGWWKDEKRLKRTEEQPEVDKNVTISVLTFTPSSDDNGKYVWCRAETAVIPGSNIQDGWLLDVHYTPIVSLVPGESVRLDNVREGDDVYLECNIRSNPSFLRVEWKFQGKVLPHNASGGVITTNQSLALQKVRREHSGAYSCASTNSEGEGESQKILLQVKHSPFCQTNLKTVFSVARDETVKIICEVEAYPAEVIFKWTSDQTSESGNDPRFEFTSQKTQSILTYTPKSAVDFGNLYCWAGNDVGYQKMPCTFTVEPAGPPDPVNNCSITNQTQTAITVDCKSGYDGGLPQTFVCDVFDNANQEVKQSLTNNKPTFLINDLRPGMNYVISIYASNNKGRSTPLSVSSATISSALVDPNGSEKLLTTVLGVVIGIVVALALIGITILIVMKWKSSNHPKRKNYQPTEHADRSNVPLRKDMDDCMESEEKSPDIICSTNEQEFPTVKVRCLQKWAYGVEVPCDSCLRHQGLSTFPGSQISCVPENSSSCRYPLRKIQPLDESAQPDIQIQANHKFRIGEKTVNEPGPCLTSFTQGNACNLTSLFQHSDDPAAFNHQESSV